MALAALDRPAAEAMVASRARPDRSTGELRTRTRRKRSQGNPFFLQELVRALIAGGGLAGARRLRTASNAQLASLPANVHACSRRIDRLDPVPFARSCRSPPSSVARPLAVLPEVSGVSRAEFGDVLRVLRRAELAFDTLRGGDAILNFRTR